MVAKEKSLPSLYYSPTQTWLPTADCTPSTLDGGPTTYGFVCMTVARDLAVTVWGRCRDYSSYGGEQGLEGGVGSGGVGESRGPGACPHITMVQREKCPVGCAATSHAHQHVRLAFHAVALQYTRCAGVCVDGMNDQGLSVGVLVDRTPPRECLGAASTDGMLWGWAVPCTGTHPSCCCWLHIMQLLLCRCCVRSPHRCAARRWHPRHQLAR